MNPQILISAIVAIIAMTATAICILGAAILFGTFQCLLLFVGAVISFFIASERMTYLYENR